jgi:hypothetical protein
VKNVFCWCIIIKKNLGKQKNTSWLPAKKSEAPDTCLKKKSDVFFSNVSNDTFDRNNMNSHGQKKAYNIFLLFHFNTLT